MDRFFYSLTLSIIAGLSTSIGSAIVLFMKKEIPKSLYSILLGFSSGVMLYISFIELFAKSLQNFVPILDFPSRIFVSGIFFIGMIFTAIIDSFIPDHEDIMEAVEKQPHTASSQMQKHSYRLSLISFTALILHNLPEGMSVFFAANYAMGNIALALTVSIALHNIPEGISVAIPYYYATGKKWMAFWIGTLSGIAEPIGGVVGYLLLKRWVSPNVIYLVNAFIAGIMVYISMNELIPTSKRYDKKGHLTMTGALLGMILMEATIFSIEYFG